MYNNTEYGVDVLHQMARTYSFRGGTEDGQWRSSITSSTWLGSMPASYSRSTSSRRAWRKVLQQLAEELRAEYMEGKTAATVGTRCSSGSNHRSSSSSSSSSSSRHRHRNGGSAGPKELQTEPNVGHLKCHKPVCGNFVRRAEVICRLTSDQNEPATVAGTLIKFTHQHANSPAFGACSFPSLLLIVYLWVVN